MKYECVSSSINPIHLNETEMCAVDVKQFIKISFNKRFDVSHRESFVEERRARLWDGGGDKLWTQVRL